MTELIAFDESDSGACFARFRLDSGELCWMRLSMKGVTVKRSGLGLLGRVLYRESELLEVAVTGAALATLYPELVTPQSMRSETLACFANAIMHCSSADEVKTVFGRAVDRLGNVLDPDRRH